VPRALAAATVGTVIAFYDLALYGFAASQQLGKLFFPTQDAYAGTLAAIGTYAVGFAMAPIGAALFGHLGDRIGRRATLILALALMGLATTAIGLVPTYAQIGLWGAAILTLLRLLQGLAIGGEWGGAVLLAVEWANRSRRGLAGALPQLGVPLGLALAYAAVQGSSLVIGDQYWAWRVPFLASAVLLAVAVFVRLAVLETPTFAKLVEERRIEWRPVREVVRRSYGGVALTCLARTGEQGPYLVYTAAIAASGAQVTRLDATNPLLAGAAAALVLVPAFGWLSDLLGRRRVYQVGLLAQALWAVPFWLFLHAGDPVFVLAAGIGTAAVWAIMAGPQAALFAETFTGRLRYSGVSLGYHLSSLTAGGPALLLAPALLGAFHSDVAIEVYVLASCMISLGAILLLKERSRQDLAVEYDQPAGTPAATAPAAQT
jgi:MFS family permease